MGFVRRIINIVNPENIMNVIENLKVLITAIEAEPTNNIDLRRYRYEPEVASCGTIYCAAGLVPTIPHFIEMGVYADNFGAPRMPGTFDIDETLVTLFWGDISPFDRKDPAFFCLFAPRAAGEWDDDLFFEFDETGATQPTDKELVLMRLKHHLKTLNEREAIAQMAADYNRDHG